LAFNEEIEEKTQDARFLFPVLIAQFAETVVDLEQLSQNDTPGALSRAIDDFNAAPGATTAQSVVDASNDLDSALAGLADEDVFADVFFGTSVSEPGKLGGAGFFMGLRLIAGGQANITETDRAVLTAYQEGLLFVASNGAQGVAHPELFDANGALVDPNNDFDSSATAAGLAIAEAGVGISRQFQFFGGPLAAGVSFKVQRIRTFEDAQRVVDNRLNTDSNRESEGNVNFDLGLAKAFGKHWRAGLAVKDVIPRNYATSQDSVVRLRPRARLGVAYQRANLQIALDGDLTRNEPIGGQRPTQEIAVGAEWTLASLASLRAGYRFDAQSNRDDVLSVGAGTVWKRLAIDLAYAQGNDTRSAALQFGVVF
ncbi:MAG: conjugal transfer protein TraF, partial [Woeseia sp.]